MKATINKSQLMKRAWSIMKSGDSYYSMSFSIALARAWEIEKANMIYITQQQEQAEKVRAYEAYKKTDAYKNRSRKTQMSASQAESYYANGAYSRGHFIRFFQLGNTPTTIT